MTAPHFHTTAEAKAAIKRIEHNHGIGSEGAPMHIEGGSAANSTTDTKAVTSSKKGDDWVHNRGIQGADGSGRGN